MRTIERRIDNTSCSLWDDRIEACTLDFSRTPLHGKWRDVLQNLSEHIFKIYDLKLATIWSLDPVNRQLILLASANTPTTKLGKPIWDYSECLSGIAVEGREVKCVNDVSKKLPKGRTFMHEHLIDKLGLKCMISIPVLNTFNMQQVISLVDLFPASEQSYEDLSEFKKLGEALSTRLELFLLDFCMRWANRLNVNIAKLEETTPTNIHRTVASTLREAVNADYVGVYVERPHGKDIKCECRSGVSYSDMIYENLGEYAELCWKENRERLAFNLGEGRVKTYKEFLPPDVEYELQSWVFVPMRDYRGYARGVFSGIRSSREPETRVFAPFTYEDIAVFESIGQAFSAHLEILMAENRRISSLDKLGHELRLPVSVFRAVAQKVERECKNQEISLRYDYFKDVWHFCDVMKRLLLELDVTRKGVESIPFEPQLTRMHADIIAPAIRFLEPLMKKKGLEKKQIKYSNIIDKIPEINVDPWLMTMLVFNLLENAIKYHGGTRDKFKVEIEGRALSETYEIIFRDNGVGIPEDFERKIFMQNVRGPNAENYDVLGEGFGLWFSGEIAEIHDGFLELRSASEPTEFVLVLPEYLKDRSPDYDSVVESNKK